MNYKNWIILRPVKDVYNSLFNNDKGISYRKGSSAFAIYAAYQLSISIQDDNVKKIAILFWLIFSAVGIGLVTIPDLIKYLNKVGRQ